MGFYKTVTLNDVLAGCKVCNPKSQRHLYDLYAGRMTAVCMRYCNDYETARDLMHEGFIRLFNHLDDFQDKGPFEAWMRRIFVNVSLEYIRRNDLLREAVDIDTFSNVLPNNENVSFSELSAEDIMNVISKLPDCARVIFNMHGIEGYGLAEIAQILNMSETAVRSQHARAKKKLRAMICELINK
ncbi:MAG: sigma-70 family RNA polymerase sigma factor [Prevotellaceae bacterium]|jgi:RNA polymerase sigma-70 factor (ECF subfamily)|nr:sigma-70 family RNA polymerase sigma factor [Prevotellaceae bacterium]